MPTAPSLPTKPLRCPALIVGAMASGHGKTTVTAALARYYSILGRKVQVFKCGPDFLDPTILGQTVETPVYQLDLWMSDESHCRDLLYRAAQNSDLILIEAAMGLYDGDNSAAELSRLFDIPLLIVIDASAMAQTFGAVAYGLANYKALPKVAGIFANKVASNNHFELLAESLPPGLSLCGWMQRDAAIELPRRHLGLVPGDQQQDLSAKLERALDALHGIDEFILDDCDFKPAIVTTSREQLLNGKRIAIARDQAFSFVYPANLDFLRDQGARLEFFSPLHDSVVPDCDAMYIPGGYPELHLRQLDANENIKNSIRDKIKKGTPLFAECGGLLYLLDELTDTRGESANMLGVIKGKAIMQEKLAHLGLHKISLFDGVLRGHSYHYSKAEIDCVPVAHSEPSRPGRQSEAFYKVGSVNASYLHVYFASCPQAAIRLFLPKQ